MPTLPVRVFSQRTALPCLRNFRSKHVLADAVSHPKYGQKIRDIAKQKGMKVEKLRDAALAELRAMEKLQTAEALSALARATPSNPQKTAQNLSKAGMRPTQTERKDGTPVVPLSSLLNLSKIRETPHTADQIEQLWKLYHASRSSGTGRGYVSAVLPSSTYKDMVAVAEKYSTFIAPIQRENTAASDEESRRAHEFYFLQWNHYAAPTTPSPVETELFMPPSVPTPVSRNSRISTVLFTPLAEYKLRQTFATPHLVITFYTDLESSHGIILMRGEITPATTDPGRYLLTQVDAQVLSLSLQTYYLWTDHEKSRASAALLKSFHETPEDFKWEELLASLDLTP